MHPYFAYGSNLVLHQMQARCPSFAARPVVVGRASVTGYALTYPVVSHGDWAGGVASIEPVPGGAVHGVVYEVDDDAIARLDEYEGVDEGLYRRGRLGVTLEDGSTRDCWTYFAIPDPAGPYLPSARYRDAIARGAREHGLPDEYVRSLEQHPVLGG